MALAEHLEIDGQHQRAAARGCGALDQCANEAAVLHHVELKPERLADSLRHVLDRADRHGREGEWYAGGRAARQAEYLSVAALHAAETDGSERERQPRWFAENGGRKIALRNVDEDALAQLDAFEVVSIGSQGLLRIRTGLRVIEECARHLAAGKPPQVLDAGHCAQ